MPADLSLIRLGNCGYDELLQSKKTETLNLWKAKHQELQKILASDTDKRKDKIAALMPDFSIPAEGEELDADTAAKPEIVFCIGALQPAYKTDLSEAIKG